MRTDRKSHLKTDKKAATRNHKRGLVGYNKKTALLEDAITQMNAGKYGRASAALKELLALDPHNMEARRLFATLHLRLGSLIPAKQAFDSLVEEAFGRQDYWLAESLLREYLAAGPRCVPYLEKLGSLHESKGNANEAAGEYVKAVEILIEDPDSENPHHAAQLFAKIRDLAPASPAAFRVAAFFDPNTGELITSPPSASSGAAEGPEDRSAEETVQSEALIESMSLATPLEQPKEVPAAAPAPPTAESIPLRDEPVSQDMLDASGESANASEEELNLTSAKKESDEVGHDLRPGSLDEAQQEEQDGINSIGSMPVHAFSFAADGLVDMPSPVTSKESAGESINLVESPPEEVCTPLDSTGQIPAPMPWEDVLESVIIVPDQQSSNQSFPTEGENDHPVAPTGEALSAEAEPPLPAAETTADPHVEALTSMDLAVEEAGSPSPVQESGELLPERASKPTWKSVLDGLWKFRDKSALDEPPSEDGRADETPAGEIPPQTEHFLEEGSFDPGPVEIPERVGAFYGSDSPSNSVSAPMPWDQVEDSAVTIPVAQDQEAVPNLSITPLAELGAEVEAEPVEELSQQVESNPSLAHEVAITEAGQSSPIPVTEDTLEAEPEFRLAGSAAPDAIQQQVAPVSDLSEGSTDQAIPEVTEPTPWEMGEELGFASEASSVGLADPEPAESSGQPVASSAMVSEALEAIASSGQSASIEEDAPESFAMSSTVKIEQPIQSTEAEKPVEVQSHVQGEPEPISIPDVAPALLAADSPDLQADDQASETRPPVPKQRKKQWGSKSEPTIVLSKVSSEETSSLSHEKDVSEEQDITEAGAFQAFRSESQNQEKRNQAGGRTEETVRFKEEPKISPVPEAPPQPPGPIFSDATQSMSPAAAAVDVLFDSSSARIRKTTGEQTIGTRSRPKGQSGVRRIGRRISSFVGSCFSTTRSIVMSLIALMVVSGALVAIAIGIVGLTWVIMEKPPSPAFQNLTSSPQRTLSDQRRNGYLLLLGIEAATGEDPIQVGLERTPDSNDPNMVLACLGKAESGKGSGPTSVSADVARGWFNAPNPVGRFKADEGAIAGWVQKSDQLLSRYKQWHRLSFEDWGFGQRITPPCTSILFVHQLFLAEGFIQGMDRGVDRLEMDMEAWRTALGQARTIPLKTLATQAINENIAVASGLLVQPDFDTKYLPRLSKLLRPLDQVELSIRWPMQSELVVATKTFDTQLKLERNEEQSFAATVASILPLPKQRRFNTYAEYYEASSKAAGQGRHGALPKWKSYAQSPPKNIMDYLTNPIENIIGLEPLAPWDLYNGLVVDTDARLRLASLQAWLRRGPSDADLLARIAKAGQDYYDPYTGLPMLVNLKKGSLYSVGHDGKDQDADPQVDVVVKIPMSLNPQLVKKTSAGSSRSK